MFNQLASDLSCHWPLGPACRRQTSGEGPAGQPGRLLRCLQAACGLQRVDLVRFKGRWVLLLLNPQRCHKLAAPIS